MSTFLVLFRLLLIGTCFVLSSLVNSSLAQWVTNGVAVSTASGGQASPTIASDGSGGAIITWQDFRSGTSNDIYAQRINASGVVQWTANGVAISTAIGPQERPTIVSDGSGGAIITWGDQRSGTSTDIYAQRINASGVVQWTANGVAISTASSEQKFPLIVSDGSGGAIITWEDWRAGTNSDIYAQRIDANGVVQWTANGAPISTVSGSQYYPTIVSDGSGGATITWQDRRSGTDWDIYAQRINAGGVVQWTTNGVAISTAIGEQWNPRIVSDGSEGAIITWIDYRNGTANPATIYAQRINASGVVQWAANGSAIPTASSDPVSPAIASDGSGGAIITLCDYLSGTSTDIYAQRINASGVVQWTANGVAISTASGGQDSPSIVSDGSGGAIITWEDSRSGTNIDIYAQRINASGVVQLTANGVAISTASGAQKFPLIVSDGSGGAIITWEDWRSGFVNSDIYAQKVATNLVVTKPISGERWIAGDQDTIRWTRGEAGQFVNIQFSTDSGATYSTINNAVPADSGYYAWMVPDSLTTRAKIRLLSTANQEVLAVSDTFKVKGYVLTRLNAAGRYEQFQRGVHSWSFINADGMWEPSWWQKFDYANGVDPHTNQPYAPIFSLWHIRARPQNFPDWPLFVRVFGVDRCYIGNWPNPAMLLRWAVAKGEYHGSCYGLAMSSLLAFELKSQWISRFEVPSFIDLYNVPPDTTVFRAINEVLTYQHGREFIAKIAAGLSKSANTTLSELKDALRRDEGGNMALCFTDIVSTPLPHIVSHAITPFKVVRSTSHSHIDTIYVYDNNDPGDVNRIVVNTATNTWEYPNNVWGWDISGSVGLYLSYSSDIHLVSPSRPGGGPSRYAQSAGTEYLKVYTSPRGSTSIIDHLGNAMEYDADDSTVVNAIPGAHPLVPITGYHHPPIGYLLPPSGTYRARVHKTQDSLSYLTTLTDSLALYAGRSNASASQSDWFTTDATTIAVRNLDAVPRVTNFGGIVIEDSTLQKTFDILNLNTLASDSLRIEVTQHDKLKLTNVGGAKSYDLQLRYVSSLHTTSYMAAAVQLSATATHLVEPRWDSLATVPVRILVDLGNNGTIDDTLIVNNTLDVDDRGDLGIPREYNLAQNYPNPFNPTTRIEYALPHAGNVNLSVYNVLGQYVATLVDEERSAGRYSVEWSGTSASGGILGSGVYFYTMIARPSSGGEMFRGTGKMLLVK